MFLSCINLSNPSTFLILGMFSVFVIIHFSPRDGINIFSVISLHVDLKISLLFFPFIRLFILFFRLIGTYSFQAIEFITLAFLAPGEPLGRESIYSLTNWSPWKHGLCWCIILNSSYSFNIHLNRYLQAKKLSEIIVLYNLVIFVILSRQQVKFHISRPKIPDNDVFIKTGS